MKNVGGHPSTLQRTPGRAPKKTRRMASEGLTKLRKALADEYIANGGMAIPALREARKKLGTPGKESSLPAVYGKQYLKHPATIDYLARAEASIMKEADKSVMKLAEMRDNPDLKETTQLQAASNLITSYLVVRRINAKLQDDAEAKNVTNNILVTNMSTEEIMKRINAIQGQPGTGGAVPGAGEASV